MRLLNRLKQKIRNPTSRKKLLLIASGIFIGMGWSAEWLFSAPVVFNGMMIVATLLAGYDIVNRAWQGLKNRHTNIELLVSIAAVGGLAIGVYWESAAVTFLFLLGGWLEARTLSKTRSTLKELVDMAPETAIVLEDGQQNEIPARKVQSGSLILVKPGGKIPVDGIVESGHTTVDESMVTGESMPAEKQRGDEVYAGTINRNGSIQVRATHAGVDTTLAKIIRRVEEAQEEKAPTQRFIEQFAIWYTPGIVALSVISFAITHNLELALTLLVIGCPGALVISTPISIISGIGRAAKKGILIKGGEYLENAGNITAIALDKTGTLTEGNPKVTDVLNFKPVAVIAGGTFEGESLSASSKNPDKNEKESCSDVEQDILSWAAIAESVSEHPLADAILAATDNSSEVLEADRFTAHTGKGIEAEYQSNHILVGQTEFIKEQGVVIDDQAEAEIEKLAEFGRTVVLVAVNGELIGALGIMDTLRSNAEQMVQELRNFGVERLLMITGDASGTACHVAEAAGIDEVHAGMLPEDKLEVVKKLQKEGHKVAMTGDGINDAPALATADLGIAMGVAGTDVAIETADLALMSDDLLKIPEALNLSKKTLRNIRQNVVVALVTVAALLTGVFLGSVHMAGGMLIHELSVMAVILNGMRLRWI
ncbi:heavy metal translocating P-type ATPase [Fodinibius sp. SL11]|uniref:heavy metal translocating P-type ATPase n=1 Tax=Fodinibius sp. SL11 TaxID=3425690 RepID=UPI003F885E31